MKSAWSSTLNMRSMNGINNDGEPHRDHVSTMYRLVRVEKGDLAEANHGAEKRMTHFALR